MEDFKNERSARMVCREGQMPEMKKERIAHAKKMIDECEGFLLIGIKEGSNVDGKTGFVCEANSSIKASMVPAVLGSMDKVAKQLLSCAPQLAKVILEDVLDEIEEDIKKLKEGKG